MHNCFETMQVVTDGMSSCSYDNEKKKQLKSESNLITLKKLVMLIELLFLFTYIFFQI